MMTTVLRILKHTDIVTSDKQLAAYIERCTARPAFKRAIEAQIGDSKSLHNWRKAHPRPGAGAGAAVGANATGRRVRDASAGAVPDAVRGREEGANSSTEGALALQKRVCARK
jgi:hypothetical protein